VQQLQFSSKGRPTVREHTNFFFQDQPVYVGDLVEFIQNGQKEISEVKKKIDGYYLNRQEVDLEDYQIVRVIDMSGKGADGRYV
jgi:hypothetical protein